VLHLHRIITDALNYAVKRQYVGVNVALAADTPKPAYREMGILDERGVHQMLDAVQGTQWHPLFVCAIYTGLRRSELLALRWRDLRIDQEEPALTVSRGLHQLRDGTFRFEPPKTASGARDVDLPPTAVLILKAHRERSEADAEILGRKIEPESLVFTSEDGGPVKPHSASQAWRRVARKLGFDVSLHGARHTHASIMLADGNADDIRMVSERLGHASPNITISIYQHLLPGRQRAAAQRFEERLARKEPTEANY